MRAYAFNETGREGELALLRTTATRGHESCINVFIMTMRSMTSYLHIHHLSIA